MTVYGALPAQEFVYCKGVTLTGLIKAEQSAAYRGDNLGLSADDPAFGRCWWQVCDCKRTSVRSNYISHAWSVLFSHDTLNTPP